MSLNPNGYSTIVCDIGSGIVKAGFSGEEGPRCIFNSIVGIPKKQGLLVGMEQKERYVGDEAISQLEIMDYISPVKRGQVADWDKYETLVHYLFYDELKIVPEEISVFLAETPLSSKNNRLKLAEILFETFNVEKIHLANSSLLALYSYGRFNGLVLDSGFNVTSSVPIYQGYPLPHASIKLDVGGEDLSICLLEMIKSKIDPSYKLLKGRILADNIKENFGYINLNDVDIPEVNDAENCIYKLPDDKEITISSELYKHCEMLFNPGEDRKDLKNIREIIIESMNMCDNEIIGDIKESICLAGGTTLLKNFKEKLRNQLSEGDNNIYISDNIERQFAEWIGGSIMSSLDNFNFLWVSKQDYYESGKSLVAIDSKCF